MYCGASSTRQSIPLCCSPLGAAGKFIKSVMKLGAMTIALSKSHQLQPHLGNITWYQTVLSYSYSHFCLLSLLIMKCRWCLSGVHHVPYDNPTLIKITWLPVQILVYLICSLSTLTHVCLNEMPQLLHANGCQIGQQIYQTRSLSYSYTA